MEVAIYDTGGKPYICYRGRRYRDTGRRLENTYGKGDCVRVVDTEQEEPVVNVEQEEPMVDTEQEDPMADDGQKKFANMLLKLVQNLSRQIEVMGQRFTTVEARQCESPRVFQIGEGLGASHHLPEQGATQRDTTQQVASHAPIRSTMPTFLGADTGAGAQQEAEPRHMGDYFAEYQAYGQEFRDALSFRGIVQLHRDSRPRDHHRGCRHYHDEDTHRTASRFHLPTFDGSSNSSAKSWVEKLDIYFQLNQISETEAIKVATLHLDGKAQDWWFHGMVTLGHSIVTTYAVFTRRLMERFDRRDLEQHFVELTRLKQTRSPETYIADFLRISMMVPNLSTARRIYIYVEGLAEPLRGLVRSARPTTLQDAISRTRDLQDVLPKTRTPYPQQ